EHIVHWVE
ncbi:MAG: hypothetical protein KDI04_15255, partial [Halieaceae bacterium]|nr:hypothetical protein [Halieaceae bacterium]